MENKNVDRSGDKSVSPSKQDMMELLHELNEVKDATQKIVGVIANLEKKKISEDALKKMRDVDDKIIYALNTSIPTESFKGQVDGSSKCKDLYLQLQTAHQQRDTAIRECILMSANSLKTLKDRRDHDRDDVSLNKQFKSEQRKLRVLQAELNVEDILKDRTLKTFNERCRTFFKAETL